MFESVVSKARNKFDLGDKANALLTALLALATDANRGGFAGFLGKFKDAGLEDVVSSWINSGANAPISDKQVEAALGDDALSRMAAQAGLDYETTTAAAAFMLPRVVDELTPEGAAPSDNDLRLKTDEFLSGGRSSAPIDGESAGETFDRIGTAAVGTAGEHEKIIVKDDSILKWLLPLIILALLVVVGFWFCGKSASPKETAARVIVNNSEFRVNRKTA